MSKGSRAVCMRFPEPYMGEIEAEAKVKGISVPGHCRRIIIERNQRIKEERVRAAQATPTPQPQTSVTPSGGPTIGTPSPRPVTAPAAPVKTESMKRVEERLSKLAKEHPEKFIKSVAQQYARGTMSLQKLAKLLEALG